MRLLSLSIPLHVLVRLECCRTVILLDYKAAIVVSATTVVL